MHERAQLCPLVISKMCTMLQSFRYAVFKISSLDCTYLAGAVEARLPWEPWSPRFCRYRRENRSRNRQPIIIDPCRFWDLLPSLHSIQLNKYIVWGGNFFQAMWHNLAKTWNSDVNIAEWIGLWIRAMFSLFAFPSHFLMYVN